MKDPQGRQTRTLLQTAPTAGGSQVQTQVRGMKRSPILVNGCQAMPGSQLFRAGVSAYNLKQHLGCYQVCHVISLEVLRLAAKGGTDAGTTERSTRTRVAIAEAVGNDRHGHSRHSGEFEAEPRSRKRGRRSAEAPRNNHHKKHRSRRTHRYRVHRERWYSRRRTLVPPTGTVS